MIPFEEPHFLETLRAATKLLEDFSQKIFQGIELHTNKAYNKESIEKTLSKLDFKYKFGLFISLKW